MLLWLFTGAFLLVGLASVVIPMVKPRKSWHATLSEGELVKLVRREKFKVMRKLKDLQTELEAGSIAQPEFERLSETYTHEVVLIQRRLDEIVAEGKHGS